MSITSLRRALAPADIARIASLALPITLGQLAVVGMTVTDVVIAGRASTDDLAAVTLGSTVFNLSIMVVIGVVLANTSIIGQARGEGSVAGVRRQFQNCLWLSAPLGLLAAASIAVGIGVLAHIDTTPAIITIAQGYLLPMLGSGFLMPFVLAFRSSFEGLGQARPPMVLNLLGFLANIPLDMALVQGWWGLPAMGGAGCGWATLVVMFLIVASQALYARYAASFARYRLFAGFARPQWSIIRKILRVGLPIGGAILAEGGFFLLIPLLIAPLGAVAVSGHAVAITVDWMMFMVPLGIAQAISVLVANAVGQGEPGHARRICAAGLALTATLALVQAGIVIAFRVPIAALYSDDTGVQELAAHLLIYAAAFRVFDAINVGGNGALRGYQDTRITLILALSAYWIIGFPVSYSLALTALWGQPMGVEGFWVGMVVTLALTACLTSARVRRTSAAAVRRYHRHQASLSKAA